MFVFENIFNVSKLFIPTNSEIFIYTKTNILLKKKAFSNNWKNLPITFRKHHVRYRSPEHPNKTYEVISASKRLNKAKCSK